MDTLTELFTNKSVVKSERIKSNTVDIDISQRVVIMAAGTGHRWHNYQNHPKQLLEIDGEPLIKRTIRQLKERGITDIIVTVKNPGQYGDLGVREYVTNPNEVAIDRIWGARELAPCIFLFGDTYYGETSLNIILSEKREYRFFGKSAGDRIKGSREIYAVKANDFVIKKTGELREMYVKGIVRKCLAGHLLICCLGFSPNPKIHEHIASALQLSPIFTELNDETIDFDKPVDFIRWTQLRGKVVNRPKVTRVNFIRRTQPHSKIVSKRRAIKVAFPQRGKPTYKAPPGWGRNKPIKTYYTIAQLVYDTRNQLLPKIPSETDLVIGIPRDGILVAYLISIFRNIPFTDLDSFCAGIISKPGIKHRNSESFKKEFHNILLVDDICASGNAMRDALKQLEDARVKKPDIIPVDAIKRCALYVTRPFEKVNQGLLHIWGCALIGPRHYEWTHCDAVHLPNTMMDIDGILCLDCPPEKDNDGVEYLEWLRTVPLKIRPQHIGCLITWRREKYRTETEAWLQKNGVTYLQLIMADREKWGNPARFKAFHYKENEFRLFIESSPRQAQEIAEITGKPVVCFETNEAWNIKE